MAASTALIEQQQQQQQTNARNESHRIELLKSKRSITVLDYCYDDCASANKNKNAIRARCVFSLGFNPSARMTEAHARIMFKLSVPAVCSPNGFPNVHTAALACHIRCFDPCACIRRTSDAIDNSIFIHETKAHNGQRHQTSPLTIFNPSFLHVSLHLPCAAIRLRWANSLRRTRQWRPTYEQTENRTNTFGWTTNNRRQIPLPTESGCVLCQHRHQTNNIANRVNRFWLLWHFSKDRKTNFPHFEPWANSIAHHSRHGRRRRRNWVAWQSGFCRHQIKCNSNVVIAVSNWI